MALASFFDKAALAVAQALGRFDSVALEERLVNSVPALVLGPGSTSAEGLVATDLLVNLLARLYPHIVIRAVGGELVNRVEALHLEARGINPRIEISDSLQQGGMILAVGTVRVHHEAPVLYVGSDGWTAKLDPTGPVSSGNTVVPFGAATAACLAAANVFRHFFQDQLEGGEPDGPIDLSLLSLKSAQEARGPRPLTNLDMQEWHLVGAGAIGSAALWTLRRADVRGLVNVVDHEALQSRRPFRAPWRPPGGELGAVDDA